MIMGKYDDIIHLPRPVSQRHAPMSIQDRAAQFSPFAALTGYDAIIAESGRLTQPQILLDEGGKALLDEKLQQIRVRLSNRPRVSFTCFQPDEKKAGGAYCTLAGQVKKIDDYERSVVLADGTAIAIDQIVQIDIL